jgi:hypothetical protein
MNEESSGKPGRSWSELSELARAAEPPLIDVRHAVLAEVSGVTAGERGKKMTSLLEALNEVMTSALLKPALALLALSALGVGYLGFRELDALFLFGSFAI